MRTAFKNPARASVVADAQARHQINTRGVMAFILCAAAPLTVVAGAGSTAYGVIGFLGVPIAYLTVGLILALFVPGYVAMARAISTSGGFYRYIGRGLGPTAGVAAAAVTLLGYNILQVSLFGPAGYVAAAGLGWSVIGWTVPWWMYALMIWAMVAVLGLRSIAANKRLLAALLIAELAVIAVIDIALISHPYQGRIDVAALNPSHLLTLLAVAVFVGGITGFIGFETGVVYTPVARSKRTVSRATSLALLVITVVYVVSTWAMTVSTGTNGIVAAAQLHKADLFFALAAGRLPAWVLDTGRLLLLTSLIAALLAFHNLIARIFFSLGQQRLLPAGFGRPGPRTAAPVWGSLTQSGFALASIITFAVAGLDPIRHVFYVLGVTGGLGVLILMTGTDAAVIGFFRRRQTPAVASAAAVEGRWKRVVAPALSGVLLLLILAATIAAFGELAQLPPGSPWRWILLGSYAAAAAAGGVRALILRRRRPDVYAALGPQPGPEPDTRRNPAPAPASVA